MATSHPAVRVFADGGQHSVQDVLSKLKFISTIKPGEKIDVASLSVQPNTLMARLYRSVLARGESRVATLEFIQQTLDRAFAFVINYEDDEGPAAPTSTLRRMLLEAISGSKAGIMSLAQTYKDDRMYVSRVETLVQTLDLHLPPSRE
jgi:hypothetical protein